MTAAEHAAEASRLLQPRERVTGSGIVAGPREVDAAIAQAHALTALALVEVERAKPAAFVGSPPLPFHAFVGSPPLPLDLLDTPAPRRRRWRRSRP